MGGRGVGRFDGRVIFVPDTAPDERVSIEITALKKNFAEGRLLKVLMPSPHRISPPCPVAGSCGGCTWQHIAYPEQLRQKQSMVRDALRKFAARGNVEVLPVVPSPHEFTYRNRVQVHYASGALGFYRRGSNEIVPIEGCLITEDALNQEFAPLRDRLKREQSGPTRIELYQTERGEVGFSDQPRFSDELGFAQVNTAQNQQLVEFVLSRLHPATPVIVDLYAGAGNFTLPVARLRPANVVVGVELHAKSVRVGRDRARAQTPNTTVHFVEAKVEDFLKTVANDQQTEVTREGIKNATVILDPPRAGCEQSVLQTLASLKPRRIIYVSCHPVTLARDLAFLAPAQFRVVEVQPFDMFPQTDHVETVVIIDHVDESIV